LAHVRLARVLLAKGAHAEAQAQLSQEPTKAFASEYAEVRGDILKAQGNKDAALTAYKKAVETLDAQAQERTMILQMKIDELKSPAVAAEEKAQ
jgi:predicted negative regulator of RcsB-dependent stress response